MFSFSVSPVSIRAKRLSLMIHSADIESFTLYKVAVNAISDAPVNPDIIGDDGFLIIQNSMTGMFSDRKDASYPLISCFIETTQLGDKNVIKASGLITEKMKAGNTNEWMTALAVKKSHLVVLAISGQEMSVNVSHDMTVIRFGKSKDNTRDLFMTYDQAEIEERDIYSRHSLRRKIPIFDSKAQAIHECFNAIRSYHSIIIPGSENINASNITDEVLRLIGMQEIKDEMKRSPSMWSGDPHRIFSSGKSYYGENTSYRNSYATPTQSSKDLANSFINMIEKEIS